MTGKFWSLWPNALSYMSDILHTSSQVLRHSPCQISASNSNFKYEFLAIFSSERAKKTKFEAFFGCKTLIFGATCLKFCMEVYQLEEYTHAKYQPNAQILSMIFLQKNPKNGLKIQNYGIFRP